MTKRAIVTVGVSPSRAFGPYHERFARTFAEHGCADGILQWRDHWPPQSPPHNLVHYGFKVYAIRHALKSGYSRVLWLDCSCWATRPIEPLWEAIARDGHFLCGEPHLEDDGFVANPENSMDRLGAWSSDKSLQTFGLSRDDAMRVTLLSGTCIGLDLENPRSRLFFERLFSYAVPEHYNGTHPSGLLGRTIIPGMTEGQIVSTDPRVQGHRSDEVFATLLARDLKMKSTGEMFTGGNAERPSTLIKSGYDL